MTGSSRGVHRGIQFPFHLWGQGLHSTDGLQPDIVLLKIGKLLLQVIAEQPP